PRCCVLLHFGTDSPLPSETLALSLHDALPICHSFSPLLGEQFAFEPGAVLVALGPCRPAPCRAVICAEDQVEQVQGGLPLGGEEVPADGAVGHVVSGALRHPPGDRLPCQLAVGKDHQPAVATAGGPLAAERQFFDCTTKPLDDLPDAVLHCGLV